jgi:hypothetical protein
MSSGALTDEVFMKFSLLVVLLTLVGCATQPTVKSWLDPVSASTITAQFEPLILARVKPTRETNERDYAQLAAIEVNRMGARRLYLVAVLWSTNNLSIKQRHEFVDSFAQVDLRLDDRSLTLARLPDDVSALGIGQSPLPLPIPGSHHVYYPVERAELRAIAQSKSAELTALGLPEVPQRYEEFKDGRQSLSEFLSQLPGEPSAGR